MDILTGQRGGIGGVQVRRDENLKREMASQQILGLVQHTRRGEMSGQIPVTFFP